MPKIEYYYALPVTCVGYILGYDVFGILISSLIIFWLWNLWVDVPEDFGYVRKEKYLKLKAEHEHDKKQLKEFAAYILKMNEQRKASSYKSHGWDKATEEDFNKTGTESNSNSWRNVLNVGLNATKLDVDIAYKILVKKYHPDINRNPDAAIRMQEINEAKDRADKYFAAA